MAEDIVSEVEAVRENDKRADIDISDIVQKYIVVGATQEWVEHYLVGLEFKLYFQPPEANGTQTLIAERSEKFVIPLLPYDEIRVIVVFSGGVVKTSRGRLILRAL